MTDRPAVEPGPTAFADALREAIHAGGVTLDRVADRLRVLGTPVSLATLSYWQSGRSQPERATSLAALANIEDMLGLPSGQLGRLIDAPKPRGRGVHRTQVPLGSSAPWSGPEEFYRVASDSGIDLSRDRDLTRLSAHDHVVIGADRTKHRQRMRQVLRAETDGVDRIAICVWGEGPHDPAPEVRPVRNCSLGRVSRDGDTGQAVTELVFDHPLARRETIVVEHEVVDHAPRQVATDHERVSRLPVREYLVEVRFDPAALPTEVVQFAEADGRQRVRALTLDSAHTAHALAMDLEPGRYGIRWTWPR